MLPRPRTRLIIYLVLCLCLFGVPIYAQDDGQTTHIVQPGENLFRIALRYGVSVDTLAQANGIADARVIYVGQVLVIPGAGTPAAAPQTDAPAVNNSLVAGETVIHVVQRGETLNTIARRYNTTIQSLMTLNNLSNPNRILVGQQLVVNAPPPAPAADAPAPAAPAPDAPPVQTVTHVVRRGEYLSMIAQRYGVDWPSIARANNIGAPFQVYAGQVLVIPNAANLAAVQTAVIPSGGAPSNPPAPIAEGRVVLVDLSDSWVYAYENGTMVYNAITSTGLPATPTVQGTFRVYLMYEAQTMSGPGYYLPDVPYVMYFYQGYALHGTYWHSNFGRPMSHGCVNLQTPDAQWFYSWVTIGTTVVVQA